MENGSNCSKRSSDTAPAGGPGQQGVCGKRGNLSHRDTCMSGSEQMAVPVSSGLDAIGGASVHRTREERFFCASIAGRPCGACKLNNTGALRIKLHSKKQGCVCPLRRSSPCQCEQECQDWRREHLPRGRPKAGGLARRVPPPRSAQSWALKDEWPGMAAEEPHLAPWHPRLLRAAAPSNLCSLKQRTLTHRKYSTAAERTLVGK